MAVDHYVEAIRSFTVINQQILFDALPSKPLR